MKAFLMFPDRDFDPQQRLIIIANPYPRRDETPPGPWEDLPPLSQPLYQDLQLAPILQAMAGEDAFIREVAKRAILSGATLDRETILYREDILRDALQNPAVLRTLYTLSIDANETVRKIGNWMSTSYPSGMLSSAINGMNSYVKSLRSLRAIAVDEAPKFHSAGFSRLFKILASELDEPYFTEINSHLKRLQFHNGVPISAEIGAVCKGKNYVLRMPDKDSEGWLRWLFGPNEESYTLTLAPRDDAGSTALGELRDRGLALVADALAQAVNHIHSFFDMLRTELAFYIACLNLSEAMAGIGAPVSIPQAQPVGERAFACKELYDMALCLGMGHKIIGNTLDAVDAGLVVVTGANRGGKTTFLRSLGQAQIMMQAGMFVPAESFTADVARGIFTHFKREEDASMSSGKLDEELARMSGIIDQLTAESLVLFNESFAATNEREGSEIARQVTEALESRHVKQACVSHLFTFTNGLHEHHQHRLFLRADPAEEGKTPFRLHEGEPLTTSFGADVYDLYFNKAA